MKNLGEWLFLIGLLVAILVALIGFEASWLTLILMLVGILVGIFTYDGNDLVNAIIRFLGLSAVAAALDGFIAIGPYLTGIFTAVVGFLGPIVLTKLVMYFLKKYFLK